MDAMRNELSSARTAVIEFALSLTLPREAGEGMS
jgi:hypothetical protein